MSDESGGDSNDRTIWKRALFMLLFAIIYSIAEIIVVLVYSGRVAVPVAPTIRPGAASL